MHRNHSVWKCNYFDGHWTIQHIKVNYNQNFLGIMASFIPCGLTCYSCAHLHWSACCIYFHASQDFSDHYFFFIKLDFLWYCWDYSYEITHIHSSLPESRLVSSHKKHQLCCIMLGFDHTLWACFSILPLVQEQRWNLNQVFISK